MHILLTHNMQPWVRVAPCGILLFRKGAFGAIMQPIIYLQDEVGINRKHSTLSGALAATLGNEYRAFLVFLKGSMARRAVPSRMALHP